MSFRKRKKLTGESNYKCALRTNEIISQPDYSTNDALIAFWWFIKEKSPNEIADMKVIRGKRGPKSADMLLLDIKRLYNGLIEYDEVPTKSKRTKDLDHTKRCRGLKRQLLQKGKACASCGATQNLELDHILPVTIGGTDELCNVQLLCKDCHRKKTESEADILKYRPNPWK